MPDQKPTLEYATPIKSQRGPWRHLFLQIGLMLLALATLWCIGYGLFGRLHSD